MKRFSCLVSIAIKVCLLTKFIVDPDLHKDPTAVCSLSGSVVPPTTANVNATDIPGYTRGVKITAAILYSITISLALVGNILVIYILYKRPETRRLTSFMYVNLAIADLLVTVIVMPQSLEVILTDEKWLDGAFGEFLAKFIFFTFFVALTASVFSLTAIAFDSFFSITRPMQSFPRFRKKAILIPSIWLSSMCLMVPWLIIITVEDSRINMKVSQFGEIQASLRGVYLFLVATIYVLPLSAMIFLYGYVCQKLRSHTLPGVAVKQDKARHRANQTKRQVMCMSIAIVAAFALSWLPAHVYHVIIAIDFNLTLKLPPYSMIVCYWCGHANSAVNPWMLIYFKKRFRSVFRKMLSVPLARMSFASRSGNSTRMGVTKPASERVGPVTEVCQFATSV